MKSLYLSLLLIMMGLLSCKTNSYTSHSNTENTDVDLGYTQVQKKNHLGSASTLEFDNEVGDLSKYLQKVPGLFVVKRGGGEDIRIRGISHSFQGSNSPLFIIDGSRVGTDYNTVKSMIRAEQVARVTVLKDPNDTAIYGMSGTNGVILIRTKTN